MHNFQVGNAFDVIAMNVPFILQKMHVIYKRYIF